MSKVSKERFEELAEEMIREFGVKFKNVQELEEDELCDDILESETFNALMKRTIMINVMLCPQLFGVPPEVVKTMMSTIAIAAFQLGKRIGQAELVDESLGEIN
jgi:hypothetical protein